MRRLSVAILVALCLTTPAWALEKYPAGVSTENPNTWSALQTFSAGLTVSGGQMLVPDDSIIGSVGETNSGPYWPGQNSRFGIKIDNVLVAQWTGNNLNLGINKLGWSSSGPGAGIGTSITGTDSSVTIATSILEQRNGTNAQESRIFATYTSATQQHYMALKTATTTLSAVSGATVTATNLIPDGAFVVGVTTRVNTGLGVSLGTTGYQVGDGTDADRWGAITGTAAGTDSDNVDATANPTGAFTAANNVVITAVGGNFDGTGAIEVAVMYLTANAD